MVLITLTVNFMIVLLAKYYRSLKPNGFLDCLYSACSMIGLSLRRKVNLVSLSCLLPLPLCSKWYVHMWCVEYFPKAWEVGLVNVSALSREWVLLAVVVILQICNDRFESLRRSTTASLSIAAWQPWQWPVMAPYCHLIWRLSLNETVVFQQHVC